MAGTGLLAVILCALLRYQCQQQAGGTGVSTDFASSSSSSNSSWDLPGRSLLQNAARVNPQNIPTTAPSGPILSWGQFSATVDPKLVKGTRIPNSFLGTSHEWLRLTDWGDNLPAFTEIFKHMGPNPILRLGGASQDKMTTAPERRVYEVLTMLHKSANVRYLIGLPMAQKNAYELSKKIMDDANKYLPSAAIFGFELGNEPEFWLPYGLGGWTADGKWVAGFEAYAQYYRRLALQLNPCSMKKPLLAGPGWGNVNTQDPKWFARILNDDVGKCYSREAAIHYYPYVQNTTIDAKGLLAQDLLDFGVEKFTVYQRMSLSYRLPLRVSEANSLYGGGRAGFSETMVGTLWCADALLAFANAGAIGFHFHWGYGGVPKEGGQPNTGVQTNFDKDLKPYPSVHAPWFGYLFFMDATAGNWWSNSDTAFVKVSPSQGTCKGNAKAWALMADSGELRVVLLNKDVSIGCNMMATIPSSHCRVGYLSRLLPGTFGMASVAGITFKGQTYVDATGVIKGKETVFTLYPESTNKDGSCNFNMAMPPASGAVLKLPNAPSGSTANTRTASTSNTAASASTTANTRTASTSTTANTRPASTSNTAASISNAANTRTASTSTTANTRTASTSNTAASTSNAANTRTASTSNTAASSSDAASNTPYTTERGKAIVSPNTNKVIKNEVIEAAASIRSPSAHRASTRKRSTNQHRRKTASTGKSTPKGH